MKEKKADKLLWFIILVISVVLGYSVWLILTGRTGNIAMKPDIPVEKTEITVSDVVVLVQPEFFLKESPDSLAVMEALEYYNIHHKNIVYAQAVLETGKFKSYICKEYKNLFGLWDSYKKDYFKFDHWTESILAYKDFIQNKYEPPNDYFLFLQEIGYAEDPMYVSKLQTIVRQIN